MERPDSYIIALEETKKNLVAMILHCRAFLDILKTATNDPGYAESARQLEKDNFTTALIPLISEGLPVLESIVWE